MMNGTINQQDALLTASEAAEYMRISKVYLWLLRKDGKIPFINIGKKILIRKSAIDAYLKANTREAAHG